MGALFFVAAMAADRGVSPAILGGACVVALIVIFLVLRLAGRSADVQNAPPLIPRRRGSRWRTLAVLAGIGLLEVTQIPAAPSALKIASVVAAAALFIWAVVTSRRRSDQL